MGYCTEFDGAIVIDPPLNLAEAEYLRKFADSRRMFREQGPVVLADRVMKRQRTGLEPRRASYATLAEHRGFIDGDETL